MKFDMKKCLHAFSSALDLAEIDYFKINLNHSRRVAYLSLMVGEILDLNQQEMFDLFAYAILHDNGLVLSTLKNNGEDYEINEVHCLEGEANVLEFPFIVKRENVIKYHHENYDGTGFFGISGNSIPFFSSIIHLADFLDNDFNLMNKPLEKKETIKSYLRDNDETMFDPTVVRACIELIKRDRFWFDLEFHSIDEVLERIIPEHRVDMSWNDIETISSVMVELIDSKSRFTQIHTTSLVKKIEIMSCYYNFDDEKRTQLRVAGNLHDIGKLYVPHIILDKPGPLNEIEFQNIKHHPYYTRLILEKIPGFELIAEWAGNHHEKLNGSGYPEGLTEAELDFESRLIAVLDIYQALTEERPYRKALSHQKTSQILFDMAQRGLIDAQITKDVVQIMLTDQPLGKSRKALIVDDDKYNIKLLEKLLRDVGIETTRASDGYEALDIMKKQLFDYCFLDIHMPGLAGIDVVKMIREMEQETRHKMIVIGVSADTSLNNKKECLDAGMDIFLEKPLFRERIYSVIS